MVGHRCHQEGKVTTELLVLTRKEKEMAMWEGRKEN